MSSLCSSRAYAVVARNQILNSRCSIGAGQKNLSPFCFFRFAVSLIGPRKRHCGIALLSKLSKCIGRGWGVGSGADVENWRANEIRPHPPTREPRCGRRHTSKPMFTHRSHHPPALRIHFNASPEFLSPSTVER